MEAKIIDLEEDLDSLRKSYNILFDIYEQDQLQLEVIYRHLFPMTPPGGHPFINGEWNKLINRIDELVGQSLQSNSNGKFS